MWREIQKGKNRMRALEHTRALVGTVACVSRGVNAMCTSTHHIQEPSMEDNEEIDSSSPFLYFADSWVGSVKSASNVGKTSKHCCVVIKTLHSRSPKFWLKEKMKDFLGRTWVVLKGKPEKEGIDLICVGYRHNKKRVLTFVMTRGAGSIKAGEPY